MVTFKDLKDEIKVGMKEKDVLRKDTFRLLVSKMEQDSKLNGKDVTELSDADVLKAVKKFVKDLEKEKSMYVDLGKSTEQVDAQINLFDKFLPTVVTGDELKTIVTAELDKMEAVNMKVLGQLKQSLTVEADFKEVSQIVKDYIAST